MTSKAVGCCDVRVFLRLRELTDGGLLPLAVKKFMDMDAEGCKVGSEAPCKPGWCCL